MPQNNKPGRRLLRQLYGSWYRVRHNISIFARWCLFAVIIGVVVGAVGAAFEHALEWATETRQEQSWTLYFLPLVGVFIAFWYSKMDMPLERGTNFILTSVRQDHPVRLRLAPLHCEHARRKRCAEQCRKARRHTAHGNRAGILVVQVHQMSDIARNRTAELQRRTFSSGRAAAKVGQHRGD